MKPKKYVSYAEIDQDLAILKLEREIHLKKLQLSFEKTKESFTPYNSLSMVGKVIKNSFSGSLGTILKIAIPLLINQFINKKSSK